MDNDLLKKLKTIFPYPEERVEILIDGSNLFATAKNLDLTIDFNRLLEFFSRYGHLIRINYYTALLQTEEHNPVKPLVDWLAYNGFNVVLKDAKQFTNADGKQWTKGNVDVDLAVDAMKAAEHVDHVVLFTGDGDFKALVKALQEKRVRVTAISSVKTSPSMIADELRKQVDHFIDLEDMREHIEKE